MSKSKDPYKTRKYKCKPASFDYWVDEWFVESRCLHNAAELSGEKLMSLGLWPLTCRDLKIDVCPINNPE